jgi:hypothetical protein
MATEVISMKNFERARAFAESQFKKQERQLSVSQKAAAEHEAAVNANTARLRALRLARDAGQDVVLEISTAKKCSA